MLKKGDILTVNGGAIYEFTYNKEGKFSQSDTALLFDLPSQDDVDEWKSICVLVSPPGISSIEFNETSSKQSFLEQGFKEVFVGVAPQRLQIIKNSMQ
eukprot:15339860-Ditylum_brightwellii.AAC.1